MLRKKTARDYTASCTPDFFGYNAQLQLQYHGRFDASELDNPRANTISELLQIGKTGQYLKMQYPSVGSSIKWRSL